MAPIKLKGILQQKGFYFFGNPFSSFAIANNVLAAFLGPISDFETAQENVYRLMIALFNILITYQHLIIALGIDSEMVWQVVAEAWPAYTVLMAREVKEIVVAFTTARRLYNKVPPKSTALTDLVDQWISFFDQLPNLPRPAQLSLGPLRSPFAGSGNSFVQGLSLTQPSSNLPPWPPQHLNEIDLTYLAETRVSSALEGITSTAPGTEQRAPPNRSTSPINIRIFICWVALISITADSDRALYMTPIGFINGDDRRTWYEFVGIQAKVLGTMNTFLEYASSAMASGKKTMVAGLLTTWYANRYYMRPLAKLMDAEGEEIFAKYAMRRHGMGIVLRLVTRDTNAKPILQVVLFDPYDLYGQVKKSFGASQMGLMRYRGKVLDRVDEWSRDMNISGVEAWWGGKGGVKVQALPGEPDSMQLASTWVQEWVNDPTPPSDAETMRQSGFKLRD